MSSTAASLKLDAAETLDVRPVLEQDGEPFVQIIEAAERILPGQSLVLIAPFEPEPLYGVLGERGFSHETERVAAGEWVVLFSREA